MFTLCKQGLLVIAAIAFASNAAVQLQAEEANAPLADAVERQDWKQAAALLTQGVSATDTQPDQMTALHWAAFHNQTELIVQLLEAGADVNAENRYGIVPLYLACLNGHGAATELLLEKGADPHPTSSGGETLLMTAAGTGVLKPVQALIKHGAKVNASNRKGQTAIMWAAAAGHRDVVAELINAGADFKTPLPSGFTPLFFAVREGRIDTTMLLLESGLDVNQPMQIERGVRKGPGRGMTPLLLAVENGHFELATRLLEAGADPDEKRTGYTPLHALTWVRRPIRGDGDPPPIGSGTLSSLAFARLLVEQGADVNARHGKANSRNGRLDRTQATPFLLAAETADLAYLELLLELGADPELTNASNTTPLLAASGVGVIANGDLPAGTEEEVIATVKLLLEGGADVNAVDDRGMTAMHGAAYKSWTKLIRFLAAHGADDQIWNQKNELKHTPLDIAEGHRPGNFRPSPETEAALQQVLQAGTPSASKAGPEPD